MTLYLANPSTQRHRFHYREPVNNLLNSVDIESGRQVEIGHAWNAAQQAEVIQQLELFGARDAAEAHGRMTKFVGLLYRDRGVISEDEIVTAHDADIKAREDRSAAVAVTSALAFDNAARARSKARPSAKETLTEVRQDIMPGSRPKGDEVDFSLTVTPDGRTDLVLPAL